MQYLRFVNETGDRELFMKHFSVYHFNAAEILLKPIEQFLWKQS